jgi:hypothetical protein
MAKPALVDAPRECIDAYCCFSSAVSGHWKHGCGIPPSLLAWFAVLWFLIAKNEFAATRVSIPGYPCYSGTITK